MTQLETRRAWQKLIDIWLILTDFWQIGEIEFLPLFWRIYVNVIVVYVVMGDFGQSFTETPKGS